MAGLAGHKGVTDGLLGLLNAAEKSVTTDIQDVALEAAIAGENAAHQKVNTTPSALSPGKPNRNWTFQMNQAITSSVTRRGTTISIRVGWLKVKQGYFLTQEHGGNLRGTTIPAMNALLAGYNEIHRTLRLNGLKVQ